MSAWPREPAQFSQLYASGKANALALDLAWRRDRVAGPELVGLNPDMRCKALSGNAPSTMSCEDISIPGRPAGDMRGG